MIPDRPSHAADPIHVACSCDENYLPDAAVTLHSLFSSSPGEKFVVHFMYDDRLPMEQMAGLEALCSQFGQTFAPKKMSEDLKQTFPFMKRFGGFNAWYRVLLPGLLPDLPKVLYLDVDLLITDSVRGLWDTDLTGKCIAAVTNPLFERMVEQVRNNLGLPDGDSYFNSGVMLMNLDEMRRFGAVEKVVEFIRDNRAPMDWADQDPLNAVLWASRVRLPPRWNANPAIWEMSWRHMPKSWTQAMRVEARDNPAIVHFVGPYKPWHFLNGSPYRKRWFEHLAQTRWKTHAIAGVSLRNRLIRPLPLLVKWKIEEGSLHPRLVVNRFLKTHSGSGSLLRDAYRGLTPAKPRPWLEQMLEALAYSRDTVFFIQVGSNDANHGDPLRQFILGRGWRGILIEPVPYVFERLRRNNGGRAGLILENVAIAAHDGTADFYSVAQTEEALPEWYDQLGSFSRANILKHAEYIPDLASRIVTLKVPTLSFESLCSKHGVGAIDLIHIDAEGYDYEVVKLIDFDAHRPTVLLYEHKHLSEADRHACGRHLAERGYETVEIGADTLCLRASEVANPLSRLGRAWRLTTRGVRSATRGSVAA